MARGVSIEAVKSSTGTPGITVVFNILDEGPYKGRMIEFTGWTNDNCKVRTAESLALCGFDGRDPKTIGKNVVQIVIEEETYVKDPGLPTEKTYKNARVKWVNDPSRGRTQFTPMAPAEKQAAFDGLRGLILDQTKVIAENRAKAAAAAGPAGNGSGANFDFGANASPAAPAPAASEPNKKAMF
jgi:hypothetical protein